MATGTRSRPAPGRRPGSRTRYRRNRLVLLSICLAVAALGANLLWGRSDPVMGNPKAPILMAWTSDSLLPRLAQAARQAEGIGAVAEARNGVGWLSAWTPAGDATRSAPSGFQIPVEILAVDPDDYSRFIPREHREAFRNLAKGGAVLGATGASLRGFDSEGTLNFSRTAVPVAGVVPDELVASHEAVTSTATGTALGIDDLKYVLVELERGTDEQEAERRLRDLLPPGARLSLRGPGEAPVFRPGGTILPQSKIKQLFGEFAARRGAGRSIQVDPRWIEENTSNVTFPLLGTTRCHNKVIPQIRAAFQDVSAKGLAGLVRRRDFGGCFAPRFLSRDPNSGISHHSWGIAFDFNVSRNPYGVRPTMDPRLVDLLERWGFTWGGRWVVPDGMHFEYLREPESANN